MLRSSHRLGLLCTLSGVLLSGCAQFGTWSAPRLAGKPSADQYDRQFALARLTERNGSLEQAEQMYRSMQQKHAGDATLEHRLGVVAARQGRFEDARQHFTKAKSAGGESAELLVDLGYCCYLMDDLPAAEQALRSALARDPNNRRARNNLGLVLGGEGRFNDSLAEFKLAGTEAEAHSNLAYVYSQAGDLKRSAEEYNLALTMNQGLRPAAEALVQIVHEKPAREKARQLANSRQRDHGPPQTAPQGPQGQPPALAQAAPVRDSQTPSAPPAPPQIATLAQSNMVREVRPVRSGPDAAAADPRIVPVSHARSAERENRVTPVAATVTAAQPTVAIPAVTIRSATTPPQNVGPKVQPAAQLTISQPAAAARGPAAAPVPAPVETIPAMIDITDYRMEESDNQGMSYGRSWHPGSRR